MSAQAVSVYGSYKESGKYRSDGALSDFKSACRSIGGALVRNGFRVIACATHETSADRYVVEGALAEAKRSNRGRPAIVWMRERGVDEHNAFFEKLQSNDPNHFESQPIARARKSELAFDSLKLADKLIVIGGGLGTLTAADAAKMAGKEVIAVGAFGGAAGQLTDGDPELNASWSPQVLRALVRRLVRAARVDFAVLTIKDTEFDGLMTALRKQGRFVVDGEVQRGTITNARGEDVAIVAMNAEVQGNLEAYEATRTLVTNFAPRAVLLVGIGGANPLGDAFFGDVVLGSDVIDFTIQVRSRGGRTRFSSKGYPYDAGLRRSASALREALRHSLAKVARRSLRFNDKELTTTNRDVREAIAASFAANRRPRVHVGQIAASDTLVKDAKYIVPLLHAHRALLVFAMEGAGAAKAARNTPIIELRAVSDVIGYRKTEDCVRRASRAAGLVATEFMRLHPLDE